MLKNCRRCGACCSDLIPISAGEIDALREYVGKHPGILRKRPIDPRKCLFLRRVLWFRRCAVYRVRPAICRVYDCSKPEGLLISEWKEQHKDQKPQSMYAAIHGQQ